jgi:DNA-directed RNA polymerase subunit E'/Rpb7
MTSPSFEQEKIIIRTIEVAPAFLNKNIRKTVDEILRKNYEKTCHEDLGLLVSIDKIINMTNIISRDSKFINFTVEFIGKVVKPEKNMNVSFIPTIISSKGIFGKLYESINFFIPENTLKNWLFDLNHFKKGKKKITTNEPCQAIITNIRFENVKYNCICELQ